MLKQWYERTLKLHSCLAHHKDSRCILVLVFVHWISMRNFLKVKKKRERGRERLYWSGTYKLRKRVACLLKGLNWHLGIAHSYQQIHIHLSLCETYARLCERLRDKWHLASPPADPALCFGPWVILRCKKEVPYLLWDIRKKIDCGDLSWWEKALWKESDLT